MRSTQTDGHSAECNLYTVSLISTHSPVGECFILRPVKYSSTHNKRIRNDLVSRREGILGVASVPADEEWGNA